MNASSGGGVLRQRREKFLPGFRGAREEQRSGSVPVLMLIAPGMFAAEVLSFLGS